MFAEKFKLNRRRYACALRKMESGRVYAVSVRLKLGFILRGVICVLLTKSHYITLSDKKRIPYTQKRRVFSVFLIVKNYLVC